MVPYLCTSCQTSLGHCVALPTNKHPPLTHVLQDGSALLAGGADKTLYLLDATTSQSTILGTHTRPIEVIRSLTIPNSAIAGPLIATGSWDCTVKLWDARVASSSSSANNSSVATLPCADRVYAMDAATGPGVGSTATLVIATASGDVHLVDLRRPTVIARTVKSPLEYQTRAVGVAPGGRVWAAGSVEGRVAVNAVNQAEAT